MKIQNLIQFVKGEIEKKEFFSMVKHEILRYVNDRAHNKSSSYIYVEDIDKGFIIPNEYIKYLLQLYLDGELLEWDIEYIMNTLDFPDIDITPEAKDVIFTLSSPEINAFIDRELIQDCIDLLEHKVEKLTIKEMDESYKGYQTIFS